MILYRVLIHVMLKNTPRNSFQIKNTTVSRALKTKGNTQVFYMISFKLYNFYKEKLL